MTLKRFLNVVGRLNRDSLPHFCRLTRDAVIEACHTRLTRLFAWWWGVRIGSGGRFSGIPRFRRAPTGSITLGERCRVLSRFTANLHGVDHPCIFAALRPGAVIRIGDDCGFSGAIICAATSVEIGDRVMCGVNCTITDTDSHSLDFRERHPQFFGLSGEAFVEDVRSVSILIEKDVWLGMGVTVLKGVTIGAGTVVAANSVVSRSLPSGVVAAGCPAKPVRQLGTKL
jgi:acetyltransferase-like isoleucine patch superfamily enzyme